jgi:hypothetical protein
MAINQTTPLTHWQRTPAFLAARTTMCHATAKGKTPHPLPTQAGNEPLKLATNQSRAAAEPKSSRSITASAYCWTIGK